MSSVVTSYEKTPQVPFLKWVGGKRWFIKKHSSLLPIKIRGRYIEPFLGSGAVFFHVLPENAILADINCDLINAYLGIKNYTEEVKSYLIEHHKNHSEKYYYKMRSCIFSDIAERAACFIYLNRTCFNGIYRVNKEGRFNVPIGDKKTVILPSDNFDRLSKILETVELYESDFENIINKSEEGDFLFLDPPYTVRHNVNGFLKYNEVLFSWQDQVRLAEAVNRARLRGVDILMTNANHKSVHSLYSKGFKKKVISRFSPISGSNKGRSVFEELVITA